MGVLEAKWTAWVEDPGRYKLDKTNSRNLNQSNINSLKLVKIWITSLEISFLLEINCLINMTDLDEISIYGNQSIGMKENVFRV